MSGKIVTEVWDHAPQLGITGNELLVLLRIADAAGDLHRMAWESLPTLSAKTGVSISTVQRSLIRLTERGVLTEPPPEKCPPESRVYKSVVRQVARVKQWGVVTVTSGQNDQVVTMTRGEFDDVGLEEVTMTTNCKLSVGSREVSSPSEKRPRGRGGSIRSGWTEPRPPRKPSARAKAAADRAAEDALDPAKVILDQPDPVWPTEEVANAAFNRRRNTRSVGPAENLARSFELAARDIVDKDSVPGQNNRKALSGSFARWMRDEGVSRAVIAGMIEAYWSPAFTRDPNIEAWKDFLAQRSVLMGNIRRKQESEQVHRDASDPAAWL